MSAAKDAADDMSFRSGGVKEAADDMETETQV